MAETTAIAVLLDGPAAGRTVTVQLINGHGPRFLGVDGGNYVPEPAAGGALNYRWVPLHQDVRAWEAQQQVAAEDAEAAR